MSWRWIIRGTCLGLLLLCAGLWGGSYFRVAGVFHDPPFSRRGAEVDAGMLTLYCFSFPNDPSPSFPHAWFTEWLPTPPSHAFTPHLLDGDFLGFFVDPLLHISWTNWGIHIPLWFPTALLTIASWIAWRKVFKRKPGRGFPVAPLASQRETRGV